ncbi:MAG: hypothetical protein ACWA5A_12580 [Marinibacterium sp.]
MDTKDKPLLIHVGYHKTATTWMQRSLFTPEHGYLQIAGHDTVDDLITGPHGLAFSPDPMQAHIARADVPDGLVPVISSELMCGNPMYGGRDSDVYAARLHAIAPGARILITIRSQLKILQSTYMQYVLRGGRARPEAFFAGAEVVGYTGFDPVHYEFDRLVRHYFGLFGSENVHVIPQEGLITNREATLQKLADFCGNRGYAGLSETARAREGASYPEQAAPALRRVNHVRKGPMNPHPGLILSVNGGRDLLYRAVGSTFRLGPLKAALASWKPVTAAVEARFAGTYGDSNARLAALLPDTDLSAYP